jgi:hypothetical protein
VAAGIARLAQAPLIARQPPSSPAPMPPPIAHESAAPLVVQRKTDPSAAGRSAPQLPVAPPQLPVAPQPHDPLPAPAAAQPFSSISATRLHTPQDLGHPPTIPVARTLDTSIDDTTVPLIGPVPLVYPRTLMYAADVAPAADQSRAPERLVVRNLLGRPAAATPWQASTGEPAALVVREQIARQPMPAPNLSAAQSRAPLPLAAAAHAAVSQPAVAAQSLPKPRQSPPYPPAPYPPAPSAPESAARSTAPQRSEQQEVDIDRIVDKVHRKFLRQLAIEGERRGVRK